MPIVKIKNRLVLFVHVPKTGGSTIEHHLAKEGPLSLKTSKRSKGEQCSEQHYHAELIEKIYAPSDIFYAFMVVRHPVSRLISEYRWQTRKKWKLSNFMPFSIWLRYVLTQRRINPYCYDNHLRPQIEFEYPGAEVFQWEDGLEKCMDSVAKTLGITAPPTLKKFTKSSNQPPKIRNDDIELINRVYSEDIKRYGYKRIPEGFNL